MTSVGFKVYNYLCESIAKNLNLVWDTNEEVFVNVNEQNKMYPRRPEYIQKYMDYDGTIKIDGFPELSLCVSYEIEFVTPNQKFYIKYNSDSYEHDSNEEIIYHNDIKWLDQNYFGIS